jgi:hypothetical protein
VPVSLIVSTVGSATLLTAGQMEAVSAKLGILTDGVGKAMLLAHGKMLTAVVLALTVAGVGGGALNQQMVGVWGTARVQGDLTPEGNTGPAKDLAPPRGVEQIRQQLRMARGHAAARWYVNRQGKTIFAIATTKVTREQFECFCPTFGGP